jgi:hypothetical protein
VDKYIIESNVFEIQIIVVVTVTWNMKCVKVYFRILGREHKGNFTCLKNGERNLKLILHSSEHGLINSASPYIQTPEPTHRLSLEERPVGMS